MTRASAETMAARLSYSHDGHLKSSTACARGAGIRVAHACPSPQHVEYMPLQRIESKLSRGALARRFGMACAQVGTSVSVRGLFKYVPVRRADLARRWKLNVARAVHVVQAYALIAVGSRPCLQCSYFHRVFVCILVRCSRICQRYSQTWHTRM